MILTPITEFFVHYTYVAILPAAIVEGPIVTVISGVLVSLGHLNLFAALFVVFLADVISDVAFYIIGRGGRRMMHRVLFVRISPEYIERLENQFHSSPWKTMIVAKISYGLGAMFMIASGASRMSWQKFLQYMLSLNLVRSIILLTIGFYFGRAALLIGPTYIRYYTIAVVVIIPTFYILYRKMLQKSIPIVKTDSV